MSDRDLCFTPATSLQRLYRAKKVSPLEVMQAVFARIDAGEAVGAREIAADRLLWGSPDDFVEQIARYRAATGCEHVHTAFGAGLPAGSSELFVDLPVSWASRTEAVDGRTSPEELLAAAHASCFAMALSGQLVRAGTPPDHLHVSATVTFDRVDEKWTVTTSELDVVGVVPGIDEEAFDAAAQAARDGCPISRALAGNVDDQRYDNLWNLDFRIARNIKLQRVTLTPSVEIFNALNNDVVLSRARNAGAASFYRIEELISPRIARVGIRMTF